MTAIIIPLIKKPAEPRRCSFCARTEDKIKKLVSSAVSAHHICDQCIAKSTKAMLDAESAS